MKDASVHPLESELCDGADGVFESVWGWQYGWCRLATWDCLKCRRQIGEDIAVLLLQSGHHRYHRSDKPYPIRTLGVKPRFASLCTRSNSPLRRVNHWFHPLIAHECP
jgi:hypothetical protein